MRKEEDQYCNDVFQAIRSAYSHGVEASIRGRDQMHRRLQKQNETMFTRKLDMARKAAAHELRVAITLAREQHSIQLAARISQVCLYFHWFLLELDGEVTEPRIGYDFVAYMTM